MKRQTFFKVMLALSIIFASFTAKAQLDTAWFSHEHSDCYIYPQLTNPECDQVMCYDSIALGDFFNNPMSSAVPDVWGNSSLMWRVAQRFDVSGSVRLSGVAFLASRYSECPNDTLTVSIMSLDMLDNVTIDPIYSKTFIVGEANIDGELVELGYIEVLFDNPITISEPYFVVFEYQSCRWEFRTGINMYLPYKFATPVVECATPDYAPKYRALFMGYGGREWNDFNDIVPMASNYDDLYAYNYGYCWNKVDGTYCDPVCAPIGISPISADSPTSIGSVELLEKAVRLYPNPANEVLNVACDYDIESIAVFDAVNRLVEERKVNSKTLQLPLANYAQGTYFITITTPKGKLNKKFVVQ